TVARSDPDAHRTRRGGRPRRRARGRRGRLRDEAVLAPRARGPHEGDPSPRRASARARPDRARRRDAEPGDPRRDDRRASGRPARVLPLQPGRGALPGRAARPRLGRLLPGRHADGRRARRAAAPQARPARPDPDPTRQRLQGGRRLKSLRGRLFAATLAALALTLMLTIAIGAVLTRQQVGRAQAAWLARQADNVRLSRRQSVSYVNSNTMDGGIRTIVDTRSDLRPYVPNVNRSSNGTTTYDGGQYIYSYRTIPARGLLLLRPASAKAAAWHPFLGDLLLAALAGAVLAAALSFVVA